MKFSCILLIPVLLTVLVLLLHKLFVDFIL